jgi:hypothetical protein
MEHILELAIRAADREDEMGVLPCEGLPEKSLIDARKHHKMDEELLFTMNAYAKANEEQNKSIYVTNLAISTRKDHHHYCAYWIDMKKRKLFLWDSASSAYRSSTFYWCFYDTAYFIFQEGLKWIDQIETVITTPNMYSFQNGGGFYGQYASFLHQNIYCHTWTLFFLELHIHGMPLWEIACLRGSHELLPLVMIKMYAECLLKRIFLFKGELPESYRGLEMVWDPDAKKEIPCPEYNDTLNRKSCALNAIEIILKAGLLRPTEQCKKLWLHEKYHKENSRHHD